VLQGPLLEEWSARARKAETSGHYWEYALEALEVKRIAPLPGAKPGSCAVDCALRETANLVAAGTGAAKDNYRSDYTVRYEMVAGADGELRIASLAIVP